MSIMTTDHLRWSRAAAGAHGAGAAPAPGGGGADSLHVYLYSIVYIKIAVSPLGNPPKASGILSNPLDLAFPHRGPDQGAWDRLAVAGAGSGCSGGIGPAPGDGTAPEAAPGLSKLLHGRI